MKRLTQEEFLESCIKIHSDKYNYSLVEYKNISKKVSIICKEHGIFIQNAKNHKDGQGCPKWYGNRNLTKEEFIRL